MFLGPRIDDMKFSIVIPTFNRKETLHQCLRAATSQTYSQYEIIVVDDGSTDGTDHLVRQEFPSVLYLQQESNRGPSSTRNLGIRAATGEIVAFTDDDCLVPIEWISRLADGYTAYPLASGVGGYVEPPSEMLMASAFARYESYLSHVVYGASDQVYFGGFESPCGATSNMSYRKSVLEEEGRFDESFPFAAGEDADLKWRVCEAGHRLLYLPIRVSHLRDYSWGAFRRQQITRGRGVIHFERKHAHQPSRLRLILRLLKRGLLFVPNSIRIGPRLAWLKLWAGWIEIWGGWLEINRLQSAG